MPTALETLMELASIDTLYHNTNASNALNILKEGKFRLPFSETNKSETQVRVAGYKTTARPIPKLFYLSTARTLGSGYIADRAPTLAAVNNPVTFVIDVRKLVAQNRGVVIRSFGYWEHGQTGRSMGSAREAEERIYSPRHTLNVKGCLKVLLVVGTGKYDVNWHQRELFSYCLKNHIPCAVFTSDNKAGFLAQKQSVADRNRAIGLLKTAKREHGYQTSEKGILPYRSKTAMKYYAKNGGVSMSEFDDLKLLVNAKDYRDVPSKLKSRYFGGWGGDDNSLNAKFSNFLHNMRAETQRGSETFDKVHALVKQMKAKTLEEFFRKLDQKWEKLRQQDSDREQREWEESQKNKQ